jgi:antirestriction protein ArdC
MSNKVYEIITQKIMDQLEKGVIPWKKPWIAEWPQNFKSKKRYRGINVHLLTMNDFDSPYWLSFKQVGEMGGRVKKGEKGTVIVFWKMLEAKDEEADEETDKKFIPLLRYYRVWNLDQTEGIDYPKPEARILGEVELIAEAEQIIADMPNKPVIKFGGQGAFYSPKEDLVNIPIREKFKTAAGYYGTVFHELGHSTGHPDRLNRPEIANSSRFGSEKYSKEELVAEMTASFLLGHIGFTDDPEIENAAAYIGSWLKKLKDDPRFVVQAAAQAQKAADYILNINEKVGDDEE